MAGDPYQPAGDPDWMQFTESTATPDGAAATRRWVVDTDFLCSNYRCIWGNGCQGVLAEPSPALMQGCCSYGAHLVDDEDLQRVVRAFVRATDFMQFADVARAEGFLRAGDEGPDSTATRVVDGACIFFNRPGEGAAKPSDAIGCSLHLAALAAGERPIDWKPNVCWQIPIKLERRHDNAATDTIIVRRWSRADWDNEMGADQPGDDLAWWCTESAEAYVNSEPLYVSARDELIELMGTAAYDSMVDLLRRREQRADEAASGE